MELLRGVGIELTYVGGVLTLAATRGDGTIGEDVTANVKTIRAIPVRLREPIDVVVRGEVYMAKDVFARLNAERLAAGEEPWKNPRNLAAGSIKLLDAREVAARPMHAILYEVVDGERVAAGHLASLARIAALGIPTSRENQHADDWDALLAAVTEPAPCSNCCHSAQPSSPASSRASRNTPALTMVAECR